MRRSAVVVVLLLAAGCTAAAPGESEEVGSSVSTVGAAPAGASCLPADTSG